MFLSAPSMTDADVTALYSENTQYNGTLPQDTDSGYDTHLSCVALKAFQLGMSKISQY